MYELLKETLIITLHTTNTLKRKLDSIKRSRSSSPQKNYQATALMEAPQPKTIPNGLRWLFFFQTQLSLVFRVITFAILGHTNEMGDVKPMITVSFELKISNMIWTLVEFWRWNWDSFNDVDIFNMDLKLFQADLLVSALQIWFVYINSRNLEQNSLSSLHVSVVPIL